jgi:type II secretory pathway pseudopilin PulG
MSLKTDQSGFSLIAVMGISAVIGLLAVLMISVVTHMYRGDHQVSQNMASNMVMNLAAALVSNANLCDTALWKQGGVMDPVIPPAGPFINPITFTMPPPGGNPTQDLRIDIIAMNGTAVIWRGMNLANFGANDVTIDHITFSTTSGGIDLGRAAILTPPASPAIPMPFTYTDPTTGTGLASSMWPGFINIWFNSPHSALRSRSFSLTVLTRTVGGLQQFTNCSGADSASQMCWELGGSLNLATFECTHTEFQRIVANSVCDQNHVTEDKCSPTIVPPSTHGTGNPANPTAFGCAPVFSFTGFDNTTGNPVCSCTLYCY